jgi:sugar lactone lactonase YvrE
MRLRTIGAVVASVAVAVGAAAVAGASGVPRAGTITTIAGTGKPGETGDGGPATGARLFNPNDVAVDKQGNVYIADWGSCRVRRVSPNGTISTFAGQDPSPCQVSGDGGPATSARIDLAAGVAVDRQGNVYIAAGGRVRKVSTTGTISTFAGGDTGRNGSLGDGGPATSARLLVPWGVAVDGQGNVYIADSRDYRVRKVSPGGTITTFAGTGKYVGPVGDGGRATSARLINPTAVAVDGKGNVYITESGSGSDRVRKVSRSGTISTVAGGGTSLGKGGRATSAHLEHPYGVTVDGKGNIYVTTGSRIYKVNTRGMIRTYVGTGVNGFSGDGSLAASAKVAAPRGLAVDGKGNLYVADTFNNRVRKVRP